MTSLVELRPRPERLLHLIRKLAAEGKIGFLNHSQFERMPERGCDIFDIKEVIAFGMIVGPIDRGIHPGEWKVKIVGKVDGTSRKMGVVVIVVRDTRILIKTTEWEDR